MNSRALLSVAIVFVYAVSAYAAGTEKYRVAAIIFAEQGSKALIEDESGEQAWYESGETLGTATIVDIAVDSVALEGAEGSSIIRLRGSGRTSNEAVSEAIAAPTEASRAFTYVGLMSEIKASEARPGEPQAAADARTMNRFLGLAETAKITAIDRVEVSTAAEARSELQQRLTSSDPIRITIEGDELKVLYVTPD